MINHQLVLDTVAFWVHVCNLPFHSKDETIIILIARKTRQVLFVDKENYGMYVRVRVSMNAYQSLKRWIKLKNEYGGWIWVQLKYERLTTFCYVCECMGHNETECQISVNYPGLANQERQFDAWLRAPVGRRQGAAYSSDRWLPRVPTVVIVG